MTRTRIAHEVDGETIDTNTQGRPELATFAKTLNRLLIEKGIHQDDLATALGISSGSISNYRNGKKEPRMAMILKIADYLEVDCHYLMTGVRSENAQLKKQIGLSDKAVDLLKKETQYNLLHWRMDMLNFLLEHEALPLLLDFLVSYTMAKGVKIEGLPSTNSVTPIVTDEDIFRLKINDIFNDIVHSAVGLFKSRPDSRTIYQLYHAWYYSERFRSENHTITEIKEGLESQGLVFNPNLFRDTDKPQFVMDEPSEGDIKDGKH